MEKLLIKIFRKFRLRKKRNHRTMRIMGLRSRLLILSLMSAWNIMEHSLLTLLRPRVILSSRPIMIRVMSFPFLQALNNGLRRMQRHRYLRGLLVCVRGELLIARIVRIMHLVPRIIRWEVRLIFCLVQNCRLCLVLNALTMHLRSLRTLLLHVGNRANGTTIGKQSSFRLIPIGSW